MIVVIDYGFYWGLFEGFEDFVVFFDMVLDVGFDGILVSVLFLKCFED